MTDTSRPGVAAIRTEGLKVQFPLGKQTLFGKTSVVHAVDGVSLSVERGTTFGIVGESGSGKTTTALAIMRLQAATAGKIWLDGEEITHKDGDSLRDVRRRMQIIFQDPYSSLNPRKRARSIVREPLDLMNIGDEQWRRQHVADLFEKVGLRPEQMELFPHQFSGGQRQRIGIARALSTKPDIVVCDEPVSALDVAVQAQILNLMRELKQEFGLTYLFISHNLGIVQRICDTIAVMYLGRVVEQANRRELFANPQHPYTKALLAAVPRHRSASKDLGHRALPAGDPPSPVNLPLGCRFASRCSLAVGRCHTEDPSLRQIGSNHLVACHLID